MSLLDLQNGSTQAAAAFVSGVLLHVALYQRGEWDLAIPKVLGVYVAVTVGAVVWDTLYTKDSLTHTINAVLWLEATHFAGIAVNMTVYRLCFHRLRSFPGPLWARLTNGYHTMLSAKNLCLYEEVQNLHRQYGDFVRIGERF
jgi:hypothetical protein